jgi:ABC-type antimicrobial peptide transport system permease subunit
VVATRVRKSQLGETAGRLRVPHLQNSRRLLVMAFAGLAFLLAMVGLFGILAYSVQQRVRDFGVR